MSDERQFCITPFRAMRDKRLTPGDKLTLGGLGAFTNKDGVCWPSIDAICEVTGMTDRGTQGCLNNLEQVGWIKRTFRPHQSTIYQVFYDNPLALEQMEGLTEERPGEGERRSGGERPSGSDDFEGERPSGGEPRSGGASNDTPPRTGVHQGGERGFTQNGSREREQERSSPPGRVPEAPAGTGPLPDSVDARLLRLVLASLPAEHHAKLGIALRGEKQPNGLLGEMQAIVEGLRGLDPVPTWADVGLALNDVKPDRNGTSFLALREFAKALAFKRVNPRIGAKSRKKETLGDGLGRIRGHQGGKTP